VNIRFAKHAAWLALALAFAFAVAGPALATGGSRTIGSSVDDRSIVVHRIGPRDAQHTALVVGVIHGNERAGLAILNRLRNIRLPDDVAIWLIEELNPDGAAANTRQNAHGVDLNRNFPYHWQAQGEPGSTYYSGPKPLSEPESRIARRFIINHNPDVTIWYHQAMALIVRSHGDLRLQRIYARDVDLPLKDIGKLPGTAVEWQNHRFRNKTAFVVELPAGSLSYRSARKHARAVIHVTTHSL
jgi:protein MpaA